MVEVHRFDRSGKELDTAGFPLALSGLAVLGAIAVACLARKRTVAVEVAR